MKTIYKYQFEIADVIAINLPVGYEILKVDTQDNKPCMWCLVNLTSDVETVYFHLYATGHKIPSNASKEKFIETIQINSFVFHLFKDLD